MPQLSSVVIHCRDQARMARFWSLVTGVPIVPEDAESIAAGTLGPTESVLLRAPDGGVSVWIAPADDLLPIGRIHVDIAATAEEQAAFLEAGATVVAERPHWTVLADPEGNEFCVFPGH